jgi:hypothetical protein
LSQQTQADIAATGNQYADPAQTPR